jgi:hypothetical protein
MNLFPLPEAQAFNLTLYEWAAVFLSDGSRKLSGMPLTLGLLFSRASSPDPLCFHPPENLPVLLVVDPNLKLEPC